MTSFVHHFKAIGELKLELQSGNYQFGSKQASFCPSYAPPSFVHHFIAICEFKMEIQSGKRQIWVKNDKFLSRVMLKFYRWPWKPIGHLFYATSSLAHHFIALYKFKQELQSGNGQIGFWPLWPWPLTLTFCMDITPVIGNDYRNLSLKFHDDTILET